MVRLSSLPWNDLGRGITLTRALNRPLSPPVRSILV